MIQFRETDTRWLSSVDTVTDYTIDRAIKEPDSIARWVRDFSLLLSTHTDSGAPPSLHNGYLAHFPHAHSDQGMKLTVHLYLLPRLRTFGAIYLFPQHKVFN